MKTLDEGLRLKRLLIGEERLVWREKQVRVSRRRAFPLKPALCLSCEYKKSVFRMLSTRFCWGCGVRTQTHRRPSQNKAEARPVQCLF